MRISDKFESGFSALAGQGVIEAIRPEDLAKQIRRTVGLLPKVNLMVLSCCDGHQFGHVTGHTFACYGEAKQHLGIADDLPDDCFHWRTENGGPFVLSEDRIARRTYRDEIDDVRRNVLASMQEGMSLKKLNVVLLIGHCRCGKVADIFETPEEYCLQMAVAKERVMAEFGLPGHHVISWLQIHGVSGRRVHHVNYSKVTRKAA